MLGLRKLFGRHSTPQYNSVNLDTALGWLGLTALPASGDNTLLPIGKDGRNNQHFLHIEVDEDNNVAMWQFREGNGGSAYSFSGKIVYGGCEPLKLVLKETFAVGETKITPAVEDIKRIFEAFGKAMKTDQAPGHICLTREPVDPSVARQNLLKYT